MVEKPVPGSVALDTMLFIYHFEDHPRFSSITEKIFEKIERGEIRAFTSYITLLEILVKPYKDKDLKAAYDYKNLLLTFPNLQFIPVGLEIADTAASLRAEYAIRTPDAIQLATAMNCKADSYITNDEALKKIKGTNIRILKDIKKF